MTERRPLALAAATTAALVIGLSAVMVEAAPRARLSRDLADALQAQQGEARDVILQADQATVTAVAARHGATIKKWLATGAVLSVSGASLDAMSTDEAVDHLSGDTMVRSMMAVTDPAIGADQVVAGTLAGLGSITGRGVSVALIDSGVFNHKALQGRIVAASISRTARARASTSWGTGRTWPASSGAATEIRVAPGVSIVSLKVLGADGSGRRATSSTPSTSRLQQGRFQAAGTDQPVAGPAGVRVVFLDDPLDQAVERAYRAGLVVVASAGNCGKTQDGAAVIGGITSPAPVATR
jgi:serine protease AprX